MPARSGHRPNQLLELEDSLAGDVGAGADPCLNRHRGLSRNRSYASCSRALPRADRDGTTNDYRSLNVIAEVDGPGLQDGGLTRSRALRDRNGSLQLLRLAGVVVFDPPVDPNPIASDGVGERKGILRIRLDHSACRQARAVWVRAACKAGPLGRAA